MGYRVDILHDVVTANDRSTIVDPMAESSETCMFSARAAVLADVAACLLQAAGETVSVASVSVEKLDAESSLLQVSLESLCRDIFGQYVCWVVVCVDFDESHVVM